MEKWYLFNVYTFCKSLCVINVGSPYGFHGDPIYIWYLYDQMWLVGYLLYDCTQCTVLRVLYCTQSTVLYWEYWTQSTVPSVLYSEGTKSTYWTQITVLKSTEPRVVNREHWQQSTDNRVFYTEYWLQSSFYSIDSGY